MSTNGAAPRTPATAREGRTTDLMRRIDIDELKLDGNAVAGLLGEVLSFETTMAEVACDRCGGAGSVGGQAAYMAKMGVVVRCASCDSALIRLAGTPEGYWLDLRGVRYLNVR